MKDDATKIGGAILAGAMIGAAIALLYAPQSGRETRKDITRAARRVKNDTVDLIEDAIDDVNAFVADLKKRAADLAERGTGLSDKARKEILLTLEQGHEAIEKQRQKIAQAIGL